MSKKIKKILVSGYGWTGSTAVIDMFKEYNSISVIPHEFDDFRTPGAIGDAIYSKLNDQKVNIGPSRRSASIAYILKFIMRGVVPNSLWPKSMKGKSIDRGYSLKLGLDLFKERGLYKKCINNISDASSEDEVFAIASNWIESVARIYSKDNSFVAFDQPIIYDCHGVFWPKVFNNYKLIVISRNPLDQMGSILRDAPYFIRPVPWNVEFLYGRDSYKNRPLSFFMETTLERYTLISETYNRIGAENMLVVQFESLVNDYKATKKSIESFIGVNSADHSKVFEYFKPDESKARLVARGELCDATYAKAEKLEKTYLNMLLDVNAI
jgi:hypothetical protein